MNDDDITDDDFEDDIDGGLDDDFDDFSEKSDVTLGDLWRDNPLVKVGIIVGAFFILILLFFMLGGESEEPDVSVVASGSTVSAPPGTEEASPAYVEAVEEVNEARIEEALREGSSALPTPIEPPIGRLSVPDEETEQEDPLQRWRRLQQERLQEEMNRTSVVEAPIEEPVINTQMIEALSEAMSTQMQAILETQTRERSLRSVGITDVSYLEQLAQAREAELQQQNAASENSEEDEEPQILLQAAEIAYAQILTEANSDIPGPVLARVASGPLKGGKLLGDFTVEDTFITLNFNTLVLNDETYPISAVALDPETTLPGMATDVDYRIFKRVILPAAAAFVEGAAEAISESGRTTITVEGDTVTEETEETTSEQEIASGITEAGQELGELLDDIADDTEILVRIAAGTPVAVLFLEAVREEPQGGAIPAVRGQTPLAAAGSSGLANTIVDTISR